MNVQVILHADFETPGVIVPWLESRGFAIQICRPFAGESLPHVSEFDWLISMGGPQSALEFERYDFLSQEVTLISEAISDGKTVWGFCLGAQLIGEALGAKSERSPHKEVGVWPVELTDAGEQDSLLRGIPSTFPVVHWHSDMPGLTTDSKVLATSEGCPRQIVRYSDSAIGFQCHPEPTRSDVEEMVRHCPEDLQPARFVQTSEVLLAADLQEINRVMTRILENAVHEMPQSVLRQPNPHDVGGSVKLRIKD